MTDDEFREAMRPLTDAMSEYAKAAAGLGEANGLVPAVGSRGMDELAAESQWSQPGWEQPTTNAFSYGLVVLHHVAEHVAAFAAVIDGSSVGPTYAHYAHVRAVMDGVTVAHWLGDLRIAFETRVKRSFVYRYNSANQIGGFTNYLPTAGAESERIRKACVDFAAANKWEFTGNGLDGEVLPRDGVGFCEIAFGAKNEALERVMWMLASATQHVKWMALAQALHQGRQEALVDPLDPSLRAVPMVVDGEALGQMGCTIWHGFRAVIDERCELMGWPKPPALKEAEAAMREYCRGAARF